MNELRISVSMEIGVMLGLFDSAIWDGFYNTREARNRHWQAAISDEPSTVSCIVQVIEGSRSMLM